MRLATVCACGLGTVLYFCLAAGVDRMSAARAEGKDPASSPITVTFKQFRTAAAAKGEKTIVGKDQVGYSSGADGQATIEQKITVKAGEKVVIYLGRISPYSWTPSQPDLVKLEKEDAPWPAPPAGRAPAVGAEKAMSFAFTAPAKGTALEFSTDRAPKYTFKLQLEIQPK